ncbi:MAG: hypothetical protein J6C82_03615 [Clostridia bacterium]|nr:hypothetical protein [Clostridia bacterium]
MIKRSEKLAFMQVKEGEEQVFKRMTGFTELSVAKNPKEYSRKYIDEDMERSAVVGYSPAISYKFDADPENSVHQVFCNVADRELTGADTECCIVIADISTADENGSCKAIMRSFCIIPSKEGDDKDTYTCSGSLKVAGEKIFGTAETSDNWQTITFTEE